MNNYKVLGMMSGTSLDGLDMALCHLWKDGDKWDFEIKTAKTITYPEWLYGFLADAVNLSSQAHDTLHETFGTWSGEEAKQFIIEKNLEVDFIASHGHTSHHRPNLGLTFQLGEGQHLANASGHKVICDFRTKDVKLGGEGAPLVPIGDELLLSEYDFCLNLGGISNMSFKKNDERKAFDIGLANMPLNYITKKINLPYDEDGKLAKKGNLDNGLLSALNALAYYKLPYPKSTGYEWFKLEVAPLIEKSSAPINDLLHTFIEHNCFQIKEAIKKEKTTKNSKMLVTGGGALNSYYVSVLKRHLEGLVEVVIPPKKFIEYKEALVFSLMGTLRELNEINVLKSVTGAKEDSCSGEIFLPKN
ncbi:anhydro-N-acetylmuramic acid kinase [Croceivirga thetidis]|uniref:Anhydro-N-acetylmuramic acid kinase n=1 Tax=Croceivirga thetidis TaxID=2721623 RepID=A0ABX1GSA2_9FLAO|nr:anhydro-N-acetylmuramic acid kinase [Croceivirga thetidis]NKI32806.1 anhydro-N-acetylmuramic acid kinase [Croceivirga thetidis]